MGILIGLMLHGSLIIFLPLLKAVITVNIEGLKIYHLMAFGVFLFNFRFGLLRGKRYNPEIEEKIFQIKKAVSEGHINKTEAKLQYKTVIRNYINSNMQCDNTSKQDITN
jgi:hypothetical protein